MSCAAYVVCNYIFEFSRIKGSLDQNKVAHVDAGISTQRELEHRMRLFTGVHIYIYRQVLLNGGTHDYHRPCRPQSSTSDMACHSSIPRIPPWKHCMGKRRVYSIAVAAAQLCQPPCIQHCNRQQEHMLTSYYFWSGDHTTKSAVVSPTCICPCHWSVYLIQRSSALLTSKCNLI